MKAVIERTKTLTSLPYRGAISRLRGITEEQFWRFQHERFLSLYADAVMHVPHYIEHENHYPRRLSQGTNVLETLGQLPILPKEAVKRNTESFWRQPALFLSAEHNTGGTTGAPLRVRASLLERGYTEAILRDRYLDIVGTATPRILRLSGFLDSRTTKRVIQTIPGTRYAYLSIYALSPDRLDEISTAIRAFAPDALHGYASALHQLALMFRDRDFPGKDELAVVSTSETLYDHQREDIERFLHARVFNEYGSQEGQHLVLECSYRSLHIHPARGIVEILKHDADSPAEPGELGRVVVTGLASRTMPLLRYDIGDSAISTGYSCDCTCGLAWPTIGTVYGRTEDLVQTRDGRSIGLLSHSTLKDWDGIQESQIVQRAYERFTYRIVPQNPESFDRAGLEAHVKRELESRTGIRACVEFEYLESIPRTAAGKLRAVVVDFDNNG